jgi:transcriptional regulator NrdR family protein
VSHAVQCSACNAHSDVLETRSIASQLRRRRQCPVCGDRWTTYETRADDVHAMRSAEVVVRKMRALLDDGRKAALAGEGKA